MADITRLSRMLNGVIRGLDLTSNTLVVSSIKIGAGQTELTQAILDNLVSLQDGSEVGGTIRLAPSPLEVEESSVSVK